MDIKLDKKDYLLYEPISLIIEITNETSDYVFFQFDHFSSSFNLTVTHNGKTIKYRGDTDIMLKPKILDSGELFIDNYQLLSPFGCTNSPPENGIFVEHLIEGDYTIELEYNFGNKISENDEDLIIKSNKLEFKVKRTKNKVHQTQLNKCLNFLHNFKKYDIEVFEGIIDEINALDKYSPYNLFSKHCLIDYYRIYGKYAKSQELAMELCNDFPNSFVSSSHARQDPNVLNMIVVSKELKGKFIQQYCKKIIEYRKKTKIDTTNSR